MNSADIKRDLSSIENVIIDEDISFSLRGILVAALILNGHRRYTREIFISLMNVLSKAASERIKARALIGIAIILDRYGKRIERDEEIKTRFEIFSDDLMFYTRMRESVYSLVRVRGGNQFNKRIREELLPDIQKFTPDFLKSIQNEEGEIDFEKLEENPEWEKMMSGSGLEKQMRKFSDMQSNGADMMLSMFESVSRDFFFNDIDSWFRPFESWELDRQGIPEHLKSVMELFSINPGACDLDKFAMLINIRRIPQAAVEMLKGTLETQSQQFKEEMKGFLLHSSIPEFELETYNFARTLYRFFTFFKQKSEFYNPFDKALAFGNWPFVGKLLVQPEIISSVADYYFKQGYLDDAIDYYRQLADNSKEEKIKDLASQKIGLAYEKKGDLNKALDIFLRSFESNPQDEWTARKIVRISNKLGNLKPEIFKALLLLHLKDKNDLTYLLPLADMEVSGKIKSRQADGQSYKFFERASYLVPDNSKISRLIIKKWLVDYNNRDEKFSEAASAAEKLNNDVEMYLAARSLTDSIGDKVDNGILPKMKDEEAIEMEKDILYVLY
ncbi:MAG: tetratricopeptide repeat protein, partial [Muribaculaceae bacterium]|nr:tetratricopeptide repeat protein [Muribaculaceae bacterium]